MRRGRPAADRAPDRDAATSTSAPARSTTRSRRLDAAPRRGPRALDRPARQRRRGAARARRAAASQVDVVTDQTSAHDPLNGYVPAGLTRRAGRRAARRGPGRLPAPRRRSPCSPTSARSATLGAHGAEAFDYGNALRGVAAEHGDDDAFAYPGFVPAYIRPLFCEGKGPFRWVALSGDPADIAAHRRRDPRPVRRPGAHRAAGSSSPRERVALPGPAGADLLARLRRAPPAPACASTRWSPRGELQGADRDRPRPPRRGLGRLARSARPRRCATAPTRSPTGRSSTRWSTPPRGASLGLVPPRRRRRHGQVDPRRPGLRRRRDAELAAERIRRMLTADPGMGVVRHADAGYPEAIDGRRAARRADPDARRRAGVSVELARRARRSCARPRTGCPTCATTARASCALEPGS